MRHYGGNSFADYAHGGTGVKVRVESARGFARLRRRGIRTIGGQLVEPLLFSVELFDAGIISRLEMGEADAPAAASGTADAVMAGARFTEKRAHTNNARYVRHEKDTVVPPHRSAGLAPSTHRQSGSFIHRWCRVVNDHLAHCYAQMDNV